MLSRLGLRADDVMRATLLRARVGVQTGVLGLATLLRLPRLWCKRMRDRHELSRLDANQLRDVGLNPAMVQREIEKPFWVG